MSHEIRSSAALPLLWHAVNLGNLNAVFDGDDVLWPQFEPAARSVDVDPVKTEQFCCAK